MKYFTWEQDISRILGARCKSKDLWSISFLLFLYTTSGEELIDFPSTDIRLEVYFLTKELFLCVFHTSTDICEKYFHFSQI